MGKIKKNSKQFFFFTFSNKTKKYENFITKSNKSKPKVFHRFPYLLSATKRKWNGREIKTFLFYVFAQMNELFIQFN